MWGLATAVANYAGQAIVQRLHWTQSSVINTNLRKELIYVEYFPKETIHVCTSRCVYVEICSSRLLSNQTF